MPVLLMADSRISGDQNSGGVEAPEQPVVPDDSAVAAGTRTSMARR